MNLLTFWQLSASFIMFSTSASKISFPQLEAQLILTTGTPTPCPSYEGRKFWCVSIVIAHVC